MLESSTVSLERQGFHEGQQSEVKRHALGHCSGQDVWKAKGL